MILSQVFVFNLLHFGFRCIRKRSEFSDTLLVREILVIEPYRFTPKSKERGQAWTEVARNVTKALETDYVVFQRSARDRFNLLREKHKAKQRNELKATGISPEINELDKALDDLLERVASNVSHEKVTEEKKTNDVKEKSTGEEVRRRSLETFAETRKRNLEENPASSTSSLKKRSRSTGSDVVTYLKEMRSQKERETELKEKQMENMSKAQQDLTNLLQQQICHQ